MSVENTPEFQKALNEACEKQYRGFIYGGEFVKAHSKDTIADTMEEMQRQRKKIEAQVEGIREHADQVRRESVMKFHPHMREITANLMKQAVGLVCPVCGEGDYGNRGGRRGKTPICYMLDKHGGRGPIPLMTPEKAKDWKPPTKKFKPKEPWELDDSKIVKAK